MRRGGGGAGRGVGAARGGTVHSTSLSMALRFGAPGGHADGRGPADWCWALLLHPPTAVPARAVPRRLLRLFARLGWLFVAHVVAMATSLLRLD